MYNVGLFSGSFNPLHLGHVSCFIQVANMCKECHIVISNGIGRSEIDIRQKFRWVYQCTKHLNNVHLHILDDDTATKDAYTAEYWETDAQKVKIMLGKPIDVVFFGNDYNGETFYTKCYPECEQVRISRNEMNSTLIRSNPYKFWDWLPSVVRPYYVKKVLLVGGESVGKSTLAINLSLHFNTNYIEEAGKHLSEKSGTDKLMLPEDFTEILLKHKLSELEALQNSNRVIFEDTDCQITKFYLNFLEQESDQKHKNQILADAISGINSYDLVLFLEPDVEFARDGNRNKEIEENRIKFSEQIKEILNENGISYFCITGTYQQRFIRAKELVTQILTQVNV